jgi:hypothetical protein
MYSSASSTAAAHLTQNDARPVQERLQMIATASTSSPGITAPRQYTLQQKNENVKLHIKTSKYIHVRTLDFIQMEKDFHQMRPLDYASMEKLSKDLEVTPMRRTVRCIVVEDGGLFLSPISVNNVLLQIAMWSSAGCTTPGLSDPCMTTRTQYKPNQTKKYHIPIVSLEPPSCQEAHHQKS